MIPPSSLGIVLAALAHVSAGALLIAIIGPGLLMAIFYALYIIVRCQLQPSLAPSYQMVSIGLSEKLRRTAKEVLPLSLIIFLVTGVIFLGVATPTEAAATGAMGAFILAFCYGQLKWQVVLRSVRSSLRVTGMMLFVITGAKAFSQILAFSGASKGLIAFVLDFPISPILIIIAMQFILLFMGTFMDTFSIIMITIPIFIPVVKSLGFDPLWFAVIMLLNMEMAMTSPPFGLSLFVMKGVAPSDTTMGDVYRAGIPFLGCDLLVMILMLSFPQIVLWLPGMMR
jgi:tripartite ATP-independent transporter DctM subunit